MRLMVVDDQGQIHCDDVISYTSRSKAEAYSKYREIIAGGRGHSFIFSDMDKIKEVVQLLDEKHCGFLLFLLCFIDYDGTVVKGQKQKTPMTKKDIARSLGIKERTFREFFKAVTSNNILLQDNGVFKINPIYHWKGSAKVENFIKSFTTEVKELYHVTKPKDLGFIYKLLPFVHRETSILCHNPFELDLQKMRPLNKTDIAKATEIDESTVFRKVERLKLNNMYVFADVSKGRGTNNIYKINPFIFYRKSWQARKINDR